jgi:putative addiction module component (TIGR02574 family)
MDTNSQSILEVALKLPEAERVLLVNRLLDSLSPEAEDPSEEALAAELDRRLAEFHQDSTSAIPWSELKRRG